MKKVTQMSERRVLFNFGLTKLVLASPHHLITSFLEGEETAQLGKALGW